MAGQIERKLRARTILPDELYVLRRADHQLEQIVQDMGRPGYVLVARQMGKTNLLLNMKRRREEIGDVVVYIDLSQRFATARACFRYIIDLAIDTNETLFEPLREAIVTEREKSKIDASLEYTRHLRLLLRAAPDKKIVIVLDEIDSLVNAAYSDTVLAHVRSTYFVRTNYVEFERLTYVLSGVAEPSDLIKDKNISPFNIGEKIYLDDFSHEEFSSFLERVGLHLPADTKASIFRWSQGNPRITWDICAAVEELLNSTRAVVPSDIDAIVTRLYLSGFDRPPVDHIRVLVESDASLPAALVSMRYGKAAAIDERTKSRLYLAGIIGDPGAEPKIRNPIVDAALSDAWLSQLEASRTDPLKNGTEHFVSQRWQQAREAFEAARSGGSLPAPQQAFLGISLYNLALYEQAVQELDPVVSKLYGETRTNAEFHLGSACILINRAKDAAEILSRASRDGTGPYKFPSQILLAAANYQLGTDADAELREAGKKEILHTAGQENVGGELGNATVVPSLIYTVAISAMAADELEDARAYLDCAAALAPAGLLPTILISRREMESDGAIRASLAVRAARAIIDNQLHPLRDHSNGPVYNERGLLGVLSALSDSGLEEEARELVSFVMGNEAIAGSCLGYIAGLLVQFSDPTVFSPKAIKALADIMRDDYTSPHDEVVAKRALAMSSSGDDKVAAIEDFLLAINAAPGAMLDEHDISHVISAIQNPISSGSVREALELISLTDNKIEAGIPASWPLILSYFKMVAELNLSYLREAQISASNILRLSSTVAPGEQEEMGEFLTNVLGQAQNTLARRLPVEMDQFRRIGRNQKVVVSAKDGKQITAKFKAVEDRLRNGQLSLVRVLPR